MIELKDAELTDVLSEPYRANPSIKAISYAYKKMHTLILSFAYRLYIWSGIDTANEETLDALAVEMRVIAYDGSFSKAKKAELIKNAFLQWSQAGTKNSLERIAALIFENAAITEWQEYNGSPFHFKIQTTNTNITGAELNRLKEIVKDYKRLSATLDEVEIITSAEPQIQKYGFSTIIAEIETLAPMLKK